VLHAYSARGASDTRAPRRPTIADVFAFSRVAVSIINYRFIATEIDSRPRGTRALFRGIPTRNGADSVRGRNGGRHAKSSRSPPPRILTFSCFLSSRLLVESQLRAAILRTSVFYYAAAAAAAAAAIGFYVNRKKSQDTPYDWYSRAEIAPLRYIRHSPLVSHSFHRFHAIPSVGDRSIDRSAASKRNSAPGLSAMCTPNASIYEGRIARYYRADAREACGNARVVSA